IKHNQLHVVVVEGEYIRQSLLVEELWPAPWASKYDLPLLASVTTEVNDVWLVPQQQPLQVIRSGGWVLVHYETIAVPPFMNLFGDFPRFFVNQNPAHRPRTCGQKKDPNLFGHMFLLKWTSPELGWNRMCNHLHMAQK